MIDMIVDKSVEAAALHGRAHGETNRQHGHEAEASGCHRGPDSEDGQTRQRRAHQRADN